MSKSVARIGEIPFLAFSILFNTIPPLLTHCFGYDDI